MGRLSFKPIFAAGIRCRGVGFAIAFAVLTAGLWGISPMAWRNALGGQRGSFAECCPPRFDWKPVAAAAPQPAEEVEGLAQPAEEKAGPLPLAPPVPSDSPAKLPEPAGPQSGPSGAQKHVSAAPLTLQDLEQIALRFNPTLVQARMAIQAAEGNRFQAGRYPNPSIGYIADEVGNDGGSGFQGGAIRQEIVTAGKLRLARAVANYEVEQARLLWEMQRRRVLNDVRAGYYEVLLAQKFVEINEELVRIAEESVQATEKLQAAQEVTRAELLQAQMEAEVARLNLVEAKKSLEGAWRRLAAVLGRPDMEPTPLAGQIETDLPRFDFQELLSTLWAQSPERAQALVSIERAKCELARQYSMRVPNIEIGAAVKYDTVSRYTVADVALSLPLPLFDRNQGRIARAQADLIAAQHELRRVELSLYQRLAEAFERYVIARQRVETYVQTILPNAQSTLEMIRAGYREGEFGYLNLLTAQRTYFEVNLNYLESLKEFWLRCVELEGMLLVGGLEPVERPESSVD